MAKPDGDKAAHDSDVDRNILEKIFGRILIILKFSWAVIKDAYFNTFFKDNVSLMAAAISFYAVLSIIPLLLVFISVSGYVLESSEQAFQQVSDFLIAVIPSSATSIIEFLHNFVQKKNVFGAIGLVGLIWAGSRIFAVVEDSVNVVWKVEEGRAFWKSKILSLGLVPASVLTLIMSILLTAIFTIATKRTVPIIGLSISELTFFWRLLQLIIPILASIILFTLIYKFLPNRHIPLLSALVGAIVAAVFWEAAKILFDIYVQKYASYTKVYGSFGTLVIFVFWIYYSAFILLVGAEVGLAFENRRTKSEFMNIFQKIDWLSKDTKR